MEPGTRFTNFATQHDHRTARPRPTHVSSTRACGSSRTSTSMRVQEIARHFLDLQPEEIFDLRAGDDDRDAVGESNDHRPRNELHRRAQAGDAQDHQHHARHQRAHEQAVDPVLRDDVRRPPRRTRRSARRSASSIRPAPRSGSRRRSRSTVPPAAARPTRWQTPWPAEARRVRP